VRAGACVPLSAALLAALLYSPMSAVPLAADPLRSGRGIFELQSYSALRSPMPKATIVGAVLARAAAPPGGPCAKIRGPGIKCAKVVTAPDRDQTC
jgi:hypothetical protein